MNLNDGMLDMSAIYTARDGTRLAPGMRIKVQVCTGRYGQTAIRQGTIVELSKFGGATIITDTAFNEDCGRLGVHYRPAGSPVYVTLSRNGYEKFNDYEHGHEIWTVVI